MGVITPWNFPFMRRDRRGAGPRRRRRTAAQTVGGDTALRRRFARGWAEIGAPEVLGLVHGYAGTGAAVIANSDYVQFTGSTATGRRVAGRLRGTADPVQPRTRRQGPGDRACRRRPRTGRQRHRVGGMFNSGQACVSVERVYVEAPVYDEFVATLTDKVGRLRQGDDDHRFRFDVGAMATAVQRDKVARHVDEAVAAGARVTTGGKPGTHGTFYEPTVLVDVDQSMTCMTEETFGPTLPVVKVADEDEAIRLANDSDYGLSASVWTRDVARGERIARRLEVGAVNVNDALANGFNFALPMGGWKTLRHRRSQRRRMTDCSNILGHRRSQHPGWRPNPASCCGIPTTNAGPTARRWPWSERPRGAGSDGSASLRGEDGSEVSGRGSAGHRRVSGRSGRSRLTRRARARCL